MDSRGRVFDNIFTERLWRSLKYEEVYIKDYSDVKEAKEGIERYIMAFKTSLNYIIFCLDNGVHSLIIMLHYYINRKVYQLLKEVN